MPHPKKMKLLAASCEVSSEIRRSPNMFAPASINSRLHPCVKPLGIRRRRIESNNFRGSVLVYTLLVLFIILATAVSIASVAVIERKGAGATARSSQAFVTADSGIDYIFKLIKKDGFSTMNVISLNLELGFTCDDSGEIAVVQNDDFARGKVVMTFKGFDENDIADCNDDIAVRYIHSVGTYMGTTRAIETTVPD